MVSNSLLSLHIINEVLGENTDIVYTCMSVVYGHAHIMDTPTSWCPCPCKKDVTTSYISGEDVVTVKKRRKEEDGGKR